MKIAPSYLLSLSAILAAVFPDVGIDAFNTTINTLWIVFVGVVVMVRQVLNKRSTLIGSRPSVQ